MLVLSLGAYKSDLSLNWLVSLLNDEEVRGHALQALGKCGNPEVLSDIEMYCNSENNGIKKVAINAAKKIDVYKRQVLPQCGASGRSGVGSGDTRNAP